MVRAGRSGIRSELRQSIERQVDFAAGAFDAEIADGADEFRVEILGVQEVQESELGIEIRGHGGGLDLLAAFQHDAARAAVAHQNFRDRRVHADLDPLARADAAMASDTEPMPPRTKPHSPRCPATPPMQWCSRM